METASETGSFWKYKVNMTLQPFFSIIPLNDELLTIRKNK